MKRRFASGTGSTSFFAFQDIITAVTGIMVLIALLMALQITSGQPFNPHISRVDNFDGLPAGGFSAR